MVKSELRRRVATLAVIGMAQMLSACATATKGNSQSIAIRLQADETMTAGAPAPEGVPCVLSNKLGRWELVAPGSVAVERSAEPLRISCEDSRWMMVRETLNESEAKVGSSLAKGAGVGAGIGVVAGALSPLVLLGVPAIGFSIVAGMTAGALYGGLAGAGVDAASGALFEYQSEITIVLQPRGAVPVARLGDMAATQP
jgi:hypothetical protein